MFNFFYSNDESKTRKTIVEIDLGFILFSDDLKIDPTVENRSEESKIEYETIDLRLNRIEIGNYYRIRTRIEFSIRSRLAHLKYAYIFGARVGNVSARFSKPRTSSVPDARRRTLKESARSFQPARSRFSRSPASRREPPPGGARVMPEPCGQRSGIVSSLLSP